VLKTRIKEYRAKHDMNQQMLAELVGVRRETIGHLERGNYNPSLKLAWDIAKVFNVPIEEIFEYEEGEK
jgi:putative transcriptional regulator